MARYGRGGLGPRFPEGSGWGRYDRFDYRYGPWRGEGFENRALGGAYPGGWERHPEERGWGYAGWAGGGPYDADTVSQRDWETGRPWGGESAADRVRAGDIMTRNPEAVTRDTVLADVAKRMRELDVGIIPVVNDEDESRLEGVITDRDIAVRAAAEGEDMKKAKVGDFMTTSVETVGENDHVRDVFSVMKREQVRRVPVTDEDGRLVGIIAQADLAVQYAGLDLQRETEVEEVIERISEPARPAWGGRRPAQRMQSRYVAGGPSYDQWYRRGEEIGDRVREGWDTVKREARHLTRGARHLLDRGYDRGYRR